MAGCACSDGDVCYEQIGGPAQMGNTQPMIDVRDADARHRRSVRPHPGRSTCTDSTTVSGLCSATSAIVAGGRGSDDAIARRDGQSVTLVLAEDARCADEAPTARRTG